MPKLELEMLGYKREGESELLLYQTASNVASTLDFLFNFNLKTRLQFSPNPNAKVKITFFFRMNSAMISKSLLADRSWCKSSKKENQYRERFPPNRLLN